MNLTITLKFRLPGNQDNMRKHNKNSVYDSLRVNMIFLQKIGDLFLLSILLGITCVNLYLWRKVIFKNSDLSWSNSSYGFFFENKHNIKYYLVKQWLANEYSLLIIKLELKLTSKT